MVAYDYYTHGCLNVNPFMTKKGVIRRAIYYYCPNCKGSWYEINTEFMRLGPPFEAFDIVGPMELMYVHWVF